MKTSTKIIYAVIIIGALGAIAYKFIPRIVFEAKPIYTTQEMRVIRIIDKSNTCYVVMRKEITSISCI